MFCFVQGHCNISVLFLFVCFWCVCVFMLCMCVCVYAVCVCVFMLCVFLFYVCVCMGTHVQVHARDNDDPLLHKDQDLRPSGL